jgi:hypothetical protein
MVHGCMLLSLSPSDTMQELGQRAHSLFSSSILIYFHYNETSHISYRTMHYEILVQHDVISQVLLLLLPVACWSPRIEAQSNPFLQYSVDDKHSPSKTAPFDATEITKKYTCTISNCIRNW